MSYASLRYETSGKKGRTVSYKLFRCVLANPDATIAAIRQSDGIVSVEASAKRITFTVGQIYNTEEVRKIIAGIIKSGIDWRRVTFFTEDTTGSSFVWGALVLAALAILILLAVL